MARSDLVAVPSASFTFAATRLAGTGPELSEYFNQAQQRFKQGYEQYWDDFWNRGIVTWTDTGPEVRDPDWYNPEQVPRFQVFSESLADSFDAASFDLLLLVLFNVVFFMAAYASFLRYDVQ